MTLQFIRCKISFSLIDSASICLHGLLSSLHAPANEINFSGHSIDLILREAQPGDWISPSLLTINNWSSDDHPIIPLFLWVLYYNVHVFAWLCMYCITGSAHVCLTYSILILHTKKNKESADTSRRVHGIAEKDCSADQVLLFRAISILGIVGTLFTLRLWLATWETMVFFATMKVLTAPRSWLASNATTSIDDREHYA